ncbi:AMP-binding enzyme, partial [Streptomyces flavovirens]
SPADAPVQLHGVRIELAEIEAARTALDTVATACALVREDRPGDRRLVAYTVPAERGGAATPSDVEQRARLTSALPPYMVPADF